MSRKPDQSKNQSVNRPAPTPSVREKILSQQQKAWVREAASYAKSRVAALDELDDAAEQQPSGAGRT
jgi:hypothetical protein